MLEWKPAFTSGSYGVFAKCFKSSMNLKYVRQKQTREDGGIAVFQLDFLSPQKMLFGKTAETEKEENLIKMLPKPPSSKFF